MSYWTKKRLPANWPHGPGRGHIEFSRRHLRTYGPFTWFWRAPGGGPALKHGPHRLCGFMINTRKGNVQVCWCLRRFM